MVIFKGRLGCVVIAIIAVTLLLLVLLLWPRFSGDQPLFGQPAGPPVDLVKIIPGSWQVIPDQYKVCDFDDDDEAEWLVIYSYDAVTDPKYSLIGGVIYDAQVNRVPQAPSDQSPYRSALLVPYKLLPDIYSEKGQGYLGETSVKVTLYPPAERGECRPGEIIVQGFSGSSFPTRLSIFRWGGKSVGYLGDHFVGNARIVTRSPDGPITGVTTYNRLNDRSALCDVQTFSRPPNATRDQLPPSLKFAADDAAQTIDFCFGAPDEPTYPEGVIAALLRGHSPKDEKEDPSPTGASYLMRNVDPPPELAGVKGPTRATYRILSFLNQGTLGARPAPGRLCSSDQVVPGSGAWLCGAERAEVVTEIALQNGETTRHRWHLISIASDAVNADVRWRIEKVEPE